MEDEPKWKRPTWGANRTATRPVDVQRWHSWLLTMSFVFGAFALTTFPFVLVVMGFPLYEVPTPASVIPHVAGYVAFAVVWIAAVFAIGWWWGPFDYPWTTPPTESGVAAEHRHAQVVLLIIYAYMAFTVAIAVGTALQAGVRSVASLVALTAFIAAAAILGWLVVRAYRKRSFATLV